MISVNFNQTFFETAHQHMQFLHSLFIPFPFENLLNVSGGVYGFELESKV